jgi:dihydrofolate synthase/folylpolyglutamate synthase
MPAALTDYAATKEWLFGLKSRGVRFGIDRMALLVEALGHPQRRYPCLHVAGTNGKGSVCAMLDAVLREAGWRTGLYTSPHLVKLGERVQVNRRILTEAEIVAYANELREHAERLAAIDPDDHPSFFEFMTGTAFLHFARQQVDIAVIEVGLGGRLDATNVVDPEVAVIASIGLDHCEILGDTVERIVVEKAGILKPGRPVVLGRLPPTALAIAREIAAERGCPVLSVADEFGDDIDRYPETNLEGTFQRWNAATAALVARTLSPRWRLTPEIVARGLRRVDWPGRWQRLAVGATPLILDASHNPDGALALEENLGRLVADTGLRPAVVVGVLGEPRARAILPVVARHAESIHLVVPHQDRASDYRSLERCIPEDFAGLVRRTTLEQVFPQPDRCSIAAAGQTVVVTGSIYLLGEVLERLQVDRPAEGRLQDW